jgi:hypothetical protein
MNSETITPKLHHSITPGFFAERLFCLNERIKQYQLAFSRGEIMRGPFGDVADHSRRERDALAVGAQPAAASDDVANYIFVVMVDLFGIDTLTRSKRDHAAGKTLLVEKIMIADFFVKFAQALQRGLELDGFHFHVGNRQQALGNRKGQ